MKLPTALCALALSATVAASPAQAAGRAPGSSVDCIAGSSSPGWIDCAGSFIGNLGGALTAAQVEAIRSTFADDGFTLGDGYVYSKSDAPGSSVFQSLGLPVLAFDPGYAAKGLFVIGLKQSNAYSFFLFDGGTNGLSSITIADPAASPPINLVAGVVSAQSNGLSHAAYIGPALLPVPEARTDAMMIAGLLAIGLLVRRRMMS